MPNPIPQPLSLSATEQAILRGFVRRQTAPQRLVRRAHIILAANEGLGMSETARRLRLNISTVEFWRKRWHQASGRLTELETDHQALAGAIEQALSDAPRSGAPPRFSAEQVVQIVTLACEDPVRHGREVTHWTPPELAQEAVKQGIVPSISASSVWRFLK